MNDEHSTAIARCCYVDELIAAGRLDEARAELGERLEHDGHARATRRYHASWARLHFARQEWPLAIEHADRALDREHEGVSIDYDENSLLLLRAESLSAAGREDEARLAIADARDRLLARAAHIKDENARMRYLRDVSDHRRTIQLALAWN